MVARAGAPLDVVRAQEVLSRWRHALHGKGWNALFLENHDIPASSPSGATPARCGASATALATMYFLMGGHALHLPGPGDRHDQRRLRAHRGDFDDVLAKNDYAQRRRSRRGGRDRRRPCPHRPRPGATPMQWDDGPQAASRADGRGWRSIPTIAASTSPSAHDPASVLNHYRRPIALRKAEPALVLGDYRLLMKDDAQIYAYQRRLDGERIAVIVNLSPHPARFDHPGVVFRHERLLLANRAVEAHLPPTRSSSHPTRPAAYYRVGKCRRAARRETGAPEIDARRSLQRRIAPCDAPDAEPLRRPSPHVDS